MPKSETFRKVAPCYFKALTGPDDPEGSFEAIVAVFNNIDLGGDRIITGAFEKSLAEWKSSGDPIPVIFSHQWDNLYAHVGTVDPKNAKELPPGDAMLPPELKDLGGLYTKGQMDLTAPGEAGAFATHLWSKMKTRAIKEWSFAYDVNAARPTKDALDLIDIGLIEVGPTLKGMNPATALLGTKARKAIEGMSAMEALEFLDELVLPPPPGKSGRRVPAASGPTAARHASKRLPLGARPEGAIEETLDQIAASASVWAQIKYGHDLYACHVEATYLEAKQVIVTAERWEDPWGEGPVWELSYTVEPAGVTIKTAESVEVEVTLKRTAAKSRLKAAIDAGMSREKALILQLWSDDCPLAPPETGDMTDMGMSDAGDGAAVLAEALDAAVDAAVEELSGENPNVEQALALLTGAEVVSDSLLEALGGDDADDMQSAGMASRAGTVKSERSTKANVDPAGGSAEEPAGSADPLQTLLELTQL
jgi:hypothetical protein